MDTFLLLNNMATSTFEATVGFPMASTTAYATSSVIRVFYGFIGAFLQYNTPDIISYIMIGLVLLIPLAIFGYYKFH